MPSKGIRAHRDGAVPVGFQSLTVTGAQAVSPTIPAGRSLVSGAWMEVQNNSVRTRMDGQAPTTTIGHFYVAGQSEYLNEQELKGLQLIAPGSDSTVVFTFYAN